MNPDPSCPWCVRLREPCAHHHPDEPLTVGDHVVAVTVGTLLVVVVVALLTWASPARAACPSARTDPADEVVRLPAGCPAPMAGVLVLEPAYARMVGDLGAADVLATRLEVELRAARAERDSARAESADRLLDVADRLDGLAERLAAARPPPSSVSDVPAVTWTAIGAVPPLACGVASYAALDDGPGRLGLSVLAAGLCGTGAVIAAWALE